VTLLVGGEAPYLTPTETPGARYFPALREVPLAALPLLAARRFRVLLAGPVGPEPKLNQSRPDAATQAIEDSRTTAGKDPSGRGELQSLACRELTHSTVEQHAREDLVLRYGGRRRERDRRRRGDTADRDLGRDVGGARFGGDVENRVELCRTAKGDRAASQREGLAEQIDAAADLLQGAGDDRSGARPGDFQPPAPFATRRLSQATRTCRGRWWQARCAMAEGFSLDCSAAGTADASSRYVGFPEHGGAAAGIFGAPIIGIEAAYNRCLMPQFALAHHHAGAV
jgi:hypothetical protein